MTWLTHPYFTTPKGLVKGLGGVRAVVSDACEEFFFLRDREPAPVTTGAQMDYDTTKER